LKEGTLTSEETQATQAADPVCGMIVEIANASEAGLAIEHEGQPYYFCGRGCKLEFLDDPARYLDSAYRPSM
jgi:xanthine dehydrogenase accessory factor